MKKGHNARSRLAIAAGPAGALRMPDRIRVNGGSRKARPLPDGFLGGVAAAVSLTPAIANAQDLGPLTVLHTYIATVSDLGPHELAALALPLGITVFAVLTAIALVRTRANAAKAQASARAETTTLKTELDRAVALLLSEPQVLIVWPAGSDEPEILGDSDIITRVPIPRRVLAFAGWLSPDKANAVERAVGALRARGQGFSMALTTLADRHVEVEGRAIGGRAVLRIKDVTGAKIALAELSDAHHRLLSEVGTLHALLENLPLPVWARDATGNLTWVNAAYAQAVEATDAAETVSKGLELLERSARDEAAHARSRGQSYAARVRVIAAGKRRIFDTLDLPSRDGSAGIGIDATEVEEMRTELVRMVEAHRRTLDQLPTAVAIFTADQRLGFYNAAYRALWDLDPAFLDQQPTDSAVLDRLRAARKLPEQADFRQWRNHLHEAYRAMEPKEHWWHLPDGRALRVVTTPNTEGGITYVFDDATERLNLERRYDALIKVQGETLDNLAEAVAVFSSDGRLRLTNPAFAKMWKLAASLLAEKPHIETIIGWCRMQHDDARLWQALRSAVTSLEGRDALSERIERVDGTVVDCSTVPLPDGGTLVTFQDVTDTVNVERALRERNDALETADELKNDFVHHVSYELRTPLTNIIGFSHLLHDDSTGPLNAKQREYLNYISSSSGALLAIINDILDLASIDAGAMKLDLGAVDVCKTMEAAAEGVRDRLRENGLTLEIKAAADAGSFTADERRIRQVLFNLLSNAIAFSPTGGTITLTAERRPEALVFSVIDRGRGIPREIVDRVFHRFESHALGLQHRGAGLGLSIVRSFVELHGGSVKLDSAEGRGTTVSCIFPLEHTARREAAE